MRRVKPVVILVSLVFVTSGCDLISGWADPSPSAPPVQASSREPLGSLVEAGRIEMAGSGFAITIPEGWTVEVAEPDPAIARAEPGTAWEALRAVASDGGIACSVAVGVASVPLSDANATSRDDAMVPYWDPQVPVVLQVPMPDVPNMKETSQWARLRSWDYPDTEHDVLYSLTCAADDAREPGDDADVENPGNIGGQLIESFEILPVEQ